MITLIAFLEGIRHSSWSGPKTLSKAKPTILYFSPCNPRYPILYHIEHPDADLLNILQNDLPLKGIWLEADCDRRAGGTSRQPILSSICIPRQGREQGLFRQLSGILTDADTQGKWTSQLLSYQSLPVNSLPIEVLVQIIDFVFHNDASSLKEGVGQCPVIFWSRDSQLVCPLDHCHDNSRMAPVPCDSTPSTEETDPPQT